MSGQTVVFLSAGYLNNYDFAAIKLVRLNLILLCGEVSYSKLTITQKNIFTSIKIVTTLPFEDKSVEILNPEHASQTLAGLLKDNPNLFLYCDDEKHLLLAAKLREEFNLSGHLLADIMPFRNKVLMKDIVAKHGIPIPKYLNFNIEQLKNEPDEYFDELNALFKLPLVIKPIDLAGSYGVSVIKTRQDFVSLANTIDNRINYEVEEFISGTLYHYDAVVDNESNIRFEEACEYLYPCADFMNGKVLGSLLMPDNDADKILILEFGRKTVSSLKAAGAAIHLELFKNTDGELIFLEIAIRPAGAHVPALYQETLNISLFTLHLFAQLGLLNQVLKQRQHSYFCNGYFPCKKGRVLKIIPPKLLSHHEIAYNIQEGVVLHSPVSLGGIAGNFKLWSDSLPDFEQDILTLKSGNFFEVA